MSFAAIKAVPLTGLPAARTDIARAERLAEFAQRLYHLGFDADLRVGTGFIVPQKQAPAH
jgi:hypothetical protein